MKTILFLLFSQVFLQVFGSTCTTNPASSTTLFQSITLSNAFQVSFTASCIGSKVKPGFFASFIPPVTGNYFVRATGLTQDLVMEIRTTSCNGAYVACNDNLGSTAATGFDSILLEAGTNYIIVIVAYSNGQTTITSAVTVDIALLTSAPTLLPTSSSVAPSKSPTIKPTTFAPTKLPSFSPSVSNPTKIPTTPTTHTPTFEPTHLPTKSPTTSKPTTTPSTSKPSTSPSNVPTSSLPTTIPSKSPTTSKPTTTPSTSKPSTSPSNVPTSSLPTTIPSKSPTTSKPTTTPTTSKPSTSPSNAPTSSLPTTIPSKSPTTSKPTTTPSTNPTYSPSWSPTKNALENFAKIILGPVIAEEAKIVPISPIVNLEYSFNMTIQVCQDANSQLFLKPNETVLTEVSKSFQVEALWPGSGNTTFTINTCINLISQTILDRDQNDTIEIEALVTFKCPKGFYSLTGTNYPSPCIACPLGTYANETKTTVCSQCLESTPMTLQVASDSESVCLECPLGSYCPIGSGPIPCPERFYEPAEAGSHLFDRSVDGCVKTPCLDNGFWCGKGAAEFISYIQWVKYEDIKNIVFLKGLVKTVSFPLINLGNQVIAVRFVDSKNPVWSKSLGYSQIPALSPGTTQLNIDSLDFPGDVIEDQLFLEWYVLSDPTIKFAFKVRISGLITSPVFNVNKPQDTVKATIPEMEIVNTLCNNSITFELKNQSCTGQPLPSYIRFTKANPFSPLVIDPQRGLPEKIPFEFDFNHPIFALTVPGRTIEKATIYKTCFSSSITLNGLDLTLIKSVEMSVTVLRGCPPGSFSPAGDDVDGCTLCAEGNYNSLVGQTDCKKCSQQLPRTKKTGATSDSFCLPDVGGFLDINNSLLVCPVGAVCSEVGLTVETLPIKPGFWRSSVKSTKVLECKTPLYCNGGRLLKVGFDQENSTSAVRRNLAEFNLSSISPDGICRVNHTGVMCFNCIPGNVKRGINRTCVLCEEGEYEADVSRITGVFMGITLTLFFLILATFGYTVRQYKIAHHNSEPSKFETRLNKTIEALDISIPLQIFVGFLQVTGGMSNSFQQFLPAFYEEVRKIFSVIALDLVTVMDFGCTLEQQNHFSSLLLTTFLPIAFILFVGLISFVLNRTVANHDALLKSEFKVTGFYLFLVTCFLVYPTVSIKILSTFACRTLDNGVSFLASDPSVNCKSQTYYQFLPFAVISTLVYPIGIPTFYFYLLYRERAKLQPYEPSKHLEHVAQVVRVNDRSIRYLKFLWRPYKTPFYWFEVFEQIRKLSQTSVVVFIAAGTSGQIIFQLLATVISLVVINSLLPYAEKQNNVLALIAQYAIFGIAMLTLLTRINNTSTGTKEYSTANLDLLSVLLFLSVPLFAVLTILYKLHKTGVLRIVLFWVDWNKYDKKLAMITMRRENKNLNARALKIEMEDEVEEELKNLVPKDFKEAMNLIRRLRDQLGTVHNEMNSKLLAFEEEAKRFQSDNAILEAEVEKNKIVIADMQTLIDEMKNENEKEVFRTRDTVHAGGKPKSNSGMRAGIFRSAMKSDLKANPKAPSDLEANLTSPSTKKKSLLGVRVFGGLFKHKDEEKSIFEEEHNIDVASSRGAEIKRSRKTGKKGSKAASTEMKGNVIAIEEKNLIMSKKASNAAPVTIDNVDGSFEVYKESNL